VQDLKRPKLLALSTEIDFMLLSSFSFCRSPVLGSLIVVLDGMNNLLSMRSIETPTLTLARGCPMTRAAGCVDIDCSNMLAHTEFFRCPAFKPDTMLFLLVLELLQVCLSRELVSFESHAARVVDPAFLAGKA
jgi:hypothetical protein